MPFRAGLILFLAVSPVALFATVSVTSLTSSLPSPQLLGTPITWTASATDTSPGPLTYKFELAQGLNGAYTTVKDFSTGNTWTWNPTTIETTYKIKMTARDFLTGQSAFIAISFVVNPRVTGTQAVVTPTAHPLVALFSAPTCPAGSTFRVSFKPSGATTTNHTNWQNCHSGTQNVLVGGMLASTLYTMNYQVQTGSKITAGPVQIPFTTGAIPNSIVISPVTVLVPPMPQSSSESIILFDGVWGYFPYAVNTAGAPVWYYPDQSASVQTTRIVPGGTILIDTDGNGTGTGLYGVQTRQQVLREVDLAGDILREVSADRVSEQLVAKGSHAISHFNHDALRLGNGYTVALGDEQMIFPAGTQGAANQVDVIGNVIVVLDQNWQLVSFWDSFQHDGGGTQLDINRAATLGETCSVDPNTGLTQLGCPPALLSSPANDWLHGNSLQLTPDNDVLFSLRNQDWVVKLDLHNDGTGTGTVLWRLGLAGDFQITGSSDPYPWFSGQHDVEFQNSTTLSLYDNGNTRVTQEGTGNSRGMILSIDQTKLIATVTTSVDLGLYSQSHGSAQRLLNGDYMWGTGSGVHKLQWFSQSNEFSLTPLQSVFNMQAASHTYRVFRLADFYTVPLPGQFF